MQMLRESRGMTRSELAEAINRPYREILRWETTAQEPRAMMLKKIAEALNVSVDYLLSDEDNVSMLLDTKDHAKQGNNIESYTIHVLIQKN